MKMEQIIRAIAGCLILLSLALGYLHSPYWHLFTAFWLLMLKATQPELSGDPSRLLWLLHLCPCAVSPLCDNCGMLLMHTKHVKG